MQITNRQYYSSLILGGACVIVAYLLLGLLPMQWSIWPYWARFWGIPFLLIGIFSEFFTRRLLWIRLYQTLMFGIMSGVSSYVLWSVLAGNQLVQNSLVVLFLSCPIFAILLFLAGPQKQAERRAMPYGPVGMLNAKTGHVDISRSPVHVHTKVEIAEDRLRKIARFSPLIAGIGMFLARLLSESGLTVGIALFAFTTFLGGLGGSLGSAFYIYSIIGWERHHKRKIRL